MRTYIYIYTHTHDITTGVNNSPVQQEGQTVAGHFGKDVKPQTPSTWGPLRNIERNDVEQAQVCTCIHKYTYIYIRKSHQHGVPFATSKEMMSSKLRCVHAYIHTLTYTYANPINMGSPSQHRTKWCPTSSGVCMYAYIYLHTHTQTQSTWGLHRCEFACVFVCLLFPFAMSKKMTRSKLRCVFACVRMCVLCFFLFFLQRCRHMHTYSYMNTCRLRPLYSRLEGFMYLWIIPAHTCIHTLT